MLWRMLAGRLYSRLTPMGEQQFDMTFMLKNPDVSGFGSWSAVEGWNGDNMNVAGWGVQCTT